jgi:hypothetical protein
MYFYKLKSTRSKIPSKKIWSNFQWIYSILLPPTVQSPVEFEHIWSFIDTWLKTRFFNEIKLDNFVQIWMSQLSCHISDRKRYKIKSVHQHWSTKFTTITIKGELLHSCLHYHPLRSVFLTDVQYCKTILRISLLFFIYYKNN